MKTKLILVAGFVVLVSAAAAITAQTTLDEDPITEPDAGQAPEPTYTHPRGDGPYMTQDNGTFRPTTTMPELQWHRYEVRSPNLLGVHFNINQQARLSDDSADDWNQVFALDASLRQEDFVSYCGPAPDFDLEVRDNQDDYRVIYAVTLHEVPPCTW